MVSTTRPSYRPLGFLDVFCLGINAIVGSSIYLFPGQLAALLGPASIFAFAFTAVLLAPVALCFAEASSRFSGHGGPALYAREAFGPHAGFAIGWLCWAAQVVSVAAVSNGIARYLGQFDPALSEPFMVKAVALLAIVGFGAVNYRGVSLGARVSDGLVVIKLLPLILFGAAGLAWLEPAHFTPFAPEGLKGLGPACFLAYFAFQGFEVVPVPAGEVRVAERQVPRALLSGLGLAAVLYMAVQAAAISAHPSLAGSERPLAEAAGALLGPWASSLVVLAAAVSMLGFVAGSSLGGPRYLVALAEAGEAPQSLASLHPRFKSPHWAVAASTVISSSAAVALDFNRLVDIANVVVAAQYLSTCAAVPRLKQLAGEPVSTAMVILPALGIGATIWLLAQAGVSEWAVAGGILAAGLALRALWRWLSGVGKIDS
ncbi:MAG: amino acid permease [Elusimicrobia bacterium]|nr:amino acid permease [Elusimicrobiota bacterium]